MAHPFDMPGKVRGKTRKQVCDLALAWLRATLERCVIEARPYPAASQGNAALHGGVVVELCLKDGSEMPGKVSAAQAARILGVSRGRVSQLLALGKLEGFREGTHIWITVDSLRARKTANPRAGRPAKGLLEIFENP